MSKYSFASKAGVGVAAGSLEVTSDFGLGSTGVAAGVALSVGGIIGTNPTVPGLAGSRVGGDLSSGVAVGSGSGTIG